MGSDYVFIDEFFSYLICTNQIDKIVPKAKEDEEKEAKEEDQKKLVKTNIKTTDIKK